MDQVLDAKAAAAAKFKEGFNCAEAILRAYREVLGLDLSDDVMRIASGFGGGLGHSGCMCGALSASTMVISLLQGRRSASDSRDPVYDSAAGFHNVFSENFGGTCCRILNPHPFKSPEQRRNCLKITSETAGLLQDYLAGKGLAPRAEATAK